MAFRMLRRFRRDGELERLRRHVPAVYRYALAVLPGEADAHAVTRATFERARARGAGARPSRAWLLDTAHGLARGRVREVETAEGPAAADACAEAERLVSRSLDAGLPRADRRRLREHLGACGECRRRAVSLRAVRDAVRSLSSLPVPAALLEERFTASAPRGSLGPDERSRMGIVNRRNAVLGWAAWQVGKRVARRKAKEAVPSIDTETKRPNKPAVAAAIAAAVGGLVFWKRQRDGGSGE